MRRSLGVVAVGWVVGFLIATALGSTHASTPGLASTLSPWALVGMVVTALLVLASALSERAERLRSTDEAPPETESAGRDAAEAERRSAARIAELETNLARELEKLESTAASLAATQLLAPEPVTAAMPEPRADVAASELEPVLRRKVVEAVAELVEHADPGEAAALAGQLEAMLGKAR